MKISKSTIQVYYLRNKNGNGWADISIDEGERSGRISISSDYGNWANYWCACGESFKDFLCGLSIDYFAGKVGEGNWVDVDATLNSWKREVLQSRKEVHISAEEARFIYDEITSLEDYRWDEIKIEMQNKIHLRTFHGYYPDVVYNVSPRFRRFWKKCYLPFIEHLKKEKSLIEQPI